MLKKVTIGGRVASYWDSSGLGAPLIMIHGYRGSANGLQRLADQFPDFRVIIPNLPGQGGSEAMRRSHSMKNYAWWLGEFADAIGVKRFYLLGHSYGSLICLVYATKHPQRIMPPLVLVSPIPPPNPLVWVVGQYYRVGRLMPPRVQNLWLNIRPLNRIGRRYIIHTKDARLHRQIMEEGEVERELNVSKANIEELSSVFELRLDRIIRRLAVRTHVVIGTSDVVTPLGEVQQSYKVNPRIGLSIIDDMGHLGVEEMPDKIAADIRPILGVRNQMGRA